MVFKQARASLCSENSTNPKPFDFPNIGFPFESAPVLFLTDRVCCSTRSAPLLSNILPHMQTLLNFITYTLPKPVLVALLYRLIVLHFASRILPTIGADAWDDSPYSEDGRPVSTAPSYGFSFGLAEHILLDI